MSDLDDEVTSISSIYGDNTLVEVSDGTLYTLTLPAQPAITLRIEFPSHYPDAPPSVLGTDSVGETAKGEGSYIVSLVRDVLADVYTPGAPCIYDLIETTDEKLRELGLDAESASAREIEQATQEHGASNGIWASQHAPTSSDAVTQDLAELGLGEAPPWTLSEVVTEKKSVFVARAAAVTSIEQAKGYLGHLLATDKKVAKATHNITAWRIRGENGVQYQDCDDDGETAAGGRVLHLMELMNVWDAMVVVTRWYGGVQLGPDRFRIINQTARDALVKGGMAAEAGKENTKKKGKK